MNNYNIFHIYPKQSHIFFVNEEWYLDHAALICIILVVCKHDSNPFYHLMFWGAHSDSDWSLFAKMCWIEKL